MPTTTVRWINDLNFIGTDASNQSVVLSASDPKVGASPSQLVLIAVSACSAVDVVEILRKKRTPINMLEISATGEHAENYPKYFKTIHIKYQLRGAGLTEKGVEQAITLSMDKYCSVAATLSGKADITTEFEILSHGEK